MRELLAGLWYLAVRRRVDLALVCWTGYCCRRLGWQIAVGRDPTRVWVTDLIVGPSEEVDRITAAVEAAGERGPAP